MFIKQTVSILFCSLFLFSNLNAAQPTEPAKVMKEDSMMKMMEQMQKATSPNENHKVFNALVGQWEHVGKWWMAADKKAEEFKGTNINQLILGNRFLQQSAKGQMMGQPFEGIGITGYDNMKAEYTSIWLDNMNTGMMSATSQFDAATKTFAEKGSLSCPMTGEKNKMFRTIWKIMDNDHYSYEMYSNGPDGKEFKNMEILYSRVK